MKIEIVCKKLLSMQETARLAIYGAISLEDKIRMQGLQNSFQKIYRELIKLYYDFEDAKKFAAIEKKRLQI